MKTRKSAISLTTIVLLMIMGFALFTGMYTYIGSNIQSAGLTGAEGTAEFDAASTNILSQSSQLDAHLTEIEVAFRNIAQAENTAFAVWNGMIGIGTMLTLPITLVSIGVSGFGALILGDSASKIPAWVISSIALAILVIIIFAVIGAVKGEARM